MRKRKAFLSMRNIKEFFRNKRILITGCTGFKGSWLCFFLSKLGANVYGFGLPPTKQQMPLYIALGLENHKNIQYFDIRNKNKILSFIKQSKPEILFHLAGQSLVKTSYLDPLDTYSSNIIGTANLLECIRQLNSSVMIKVAVIITTDKCYQDLGNQAPHTEQDPLGGYDPYATSKVCTEFIVDSYRKSYFNTLGVGIATARSGNILGGGDFGEFRLVPDIIRTIVAKRPLYLRSPQAMRPWQYVLDALYGYLLLAVSLYESPLEFNEAFNFSNTQIEQVTVLSIAKKLLAQIGGIDTMIHCQAEDFHETRYLQLDSYKARNRLNWIPKLGLEEMLFELSTWYSSYLRGENLSTISHILLNNYINKIKHISDYESKAYI